MRTILVILAVLSTLTGCAHINAVAGATAKTIGTCRQPAFVHQTGPFSSQTVVFGQSPYAGYYGGVFNSSYVPVGPYCNGDPALCGMLSAPVIGGPNGVQNAHVDASVLLDGRRGTDVLALTGEAAVERMNTMQDQLNTVDDRSDATKDAVLEMLDKNLSGSGGCVQPGGCGSLVIDSRTNTDIRIKAKK